jgi:hypothetical protein
LLKVIQAHFKFGSDITDADAVLRKLVRDSAPKYGTRIDRKAVKAFSDYLVGAGLITNPVDPASFVYAKAP